MNDGRTNLSSHPTSPPSSADAVRGFVRFLRTLRYRRWYLFIALGTAGLLGTIYYCTARPTYRATASLMVMHAGGEVWDRSLARDSRQEDLIPTFERLFLQSAIIDGAIRRIRELPKEWQADFARYPLDEWPDALLDNLTVRSVRRTKLIDLGYISENPRAAEGILNALLESYLEFVERTHHDVSLEIVNILDREQQQVAQDLGQKQREFRELSLRAESLGLRDHATVVHPVVARVVELNNTLIRVRKDRLQLQTSLEAIQIACRDRRDFRPHLVSLEPIVGRDLLFSTMGLDAESRESANRMAEKLLEGYARLNTLLGHFGERHPEIVQLRLEINSAEQFLARHDARQHEPSIPPAEERLGETLISMVEGRLAEISNYERELQVQYTQAAREASELEDQMVELSLIDHEIQLLRNLHDTLTNRIADLGIRQNKSDVRLATVSPPAARNEPISPQLPLVAALSVIGGLTGGILWVYAVDLLDDRFRSLQEIGDQLRLPVLGVTQRLPDYAARGIEAIHVHVAPGSPETESFHSLRTALALTSEDRQRVAITSSEPGDGKTTVLVNLAVSMTKAGKRILLIEADLRRPGLKRYVNRPASEGLSDILRSDQAFAICCVNRIQPTGIPGLEVLLSGPKPADPAELLSRPRFADLIGWAETVYDYVLIDCPPALAASDTAIIGRVVDNMLLLVQPDKNHRRVVLSAAESLLNMKVRIAGVVLNRMNSADDYDYGSCIYEYGGENGTDAGELDHVGTGSSGALTQHSRAA